LQYLLSCRSWATAAPETPGSAAEDTADPERGEDLFTGEVSEAAASAAEGLAEEAAASAAEAPRDDGEMKTAENFFTPEEQERIRQAVIAAEKRTSGEIVPMIIGASRPYAEIEMTGLAAGLVAGTLAALLFHDPWGSLQLQLSLPVAGGALGFLLCRVPAIKRRLIPRKQIEEAVDLRALAAFTAHGLHHTKDHTGILILASLFEHEVEVLADRGINEKVQPETWKEVVGILTAGLKSGTACQGFCAAIEKCGDILAQHFPRAPDDRDELANRLVTDR
jgi:putative membrane protein